MIKWIFWTKQKILHSENTSIMKVESKKSYGRIVTIIFSYFVVQFKGQGDSKLKLIVANAWHFYRR